MHEYFKVANLRTGTIWLQDDMGQVLIFTRGEQRDIIMDAIDKKEPNFTPFLFFELVNEENNILIKDE
jgi:hypothetical protein